MLTFYYTKLWRQFIMKKCLKFELSTNSAFELDWNYFLNEITNVFSLNAFEVKRLENSMVAKLIAAIPYAAGCNEPERTAIAHLITYVSEIKGFQKYFAHLQSDDFNIYNRLNKLSNFSGGDKKIIHQGMTMLALSMLNGYNKTRDYDKQNKLYNPLNSGSWDYESQKQELEFELKNSEYSWLQDIFKIGAVNSWW